MGDCFISRRGLAYTPPSNKYFFGYDINLSEPNPQLRVSYPLEVNNYGYLPAKMEYATGVFDYGSWSNIAGNAFMPRPCMLNYDGTVAYYLDPNDYTKKEDGTASDVSNVNFPGNAMMEWGKIFTKRWETLDGIYHFRCSDVQLDSDYECWCNYDINDNQIEHFYTPIYYGSLVSGKLRSISGQAYMVSQTRQTEINYAKANGADWYTEVLSDRLLIQDLLVLMAKSTDGQVAYGVGSNAQSMSLDQGSMNNRGLFWGGNTLASGVKIFGMENWWGYLCRATAGWIYTSAGHLIKITRGVKDGSTASDYNVTGAGYLSAPKITGTSNSGITKMQTYPFGRIPIQLNGSTSTYEADMVYYTAGYALLGNWSGGMDQGPFHATLNWGAGSQIVGFGAAISCKPSATQ